MPLTDRTAADAPAPNEGAGRVAASGVSGSPETTPATDDGKQQVPGFGRWLIEVVGLLALAFVLQFAVKAYVVQPFLIPSTSMESTLLIGDRVLVDKLAYRFGREPGRGDIVVFDSVEEPGTQVIKRVIAVAGQSVDVQDGAVLIDGKRVAEPYVNTEFPDHYDSDGTVKIPAGTVWVMGDNRANSRDSRFTGPVPLRTIEGRAFAIYWPIDRVRGL